MPTLRGRVLCVSVLLYWLWQGRGALAAHAFCVEGSLKGGVRTAWASMPTLRGRALCIFVLCVLVVAGRVGNCCPRVLRRKQPERGNAYRVGINARPTGSCVTFRLPYPVRRTIWPITSLFGFRAWRSRSESGRGVPNICAAISVAQRGAVASPRLPWAVLA